MTDLENQLAEECEKLIFTIRQVVSHWESGDLAAAIREAGICADETVDFLAKTYAG